MKQATQTHYVCSVCGHIEKKWLGRCPECGQWNTFEEEAVQEAPSPTKVAVMGSSPDPRKLSDITVEPGYRFSSGITEFDRVLGGGVMKGSSILIGGEPGIGKSTLMLQMAARIGSELSVLYVSGEESPGQVKLRSERLGLAGEGISIFCDTRVETLLSVIERMKPAVVVIDSLQTLVSSDIPSPAGAVNQIRACSTALVGLAKRLGITLFFVGHITKEGVLAGPKVIEHLVDTVLQFEEAGSGIRMLRALKNRFGSVDELGIFRMGEKGLEPVEDPSEFFISRRTGRIPAGIAYTAVTEGSRTFVVEIQALTVSAKTGYSRVYSDRIDTARVSRVAAILEKHAGLGLASSDIYINVGGGIKLSEVSIELPLALAIWSAFSGRPLPEKLVSFGELSLAGEIRPVGLTQKRVKSALEMGFERILVPASTPLGKLTKLSRAATIQEALNLFS